MQSELEFIDAILSDNKALAFSLFEKIISKKLDKRIMEMRLHLAKHLLEAPDRAFNVPQEPVRQGVEPADSYSVNVTSKKKKTANPDVLVNEVLDKDDPAGEWIKDFIQSDNPKFHGKTKEQRKQMALAAWYSAQRQKKGD